MAENRTNLPQTTQRRQSDMGDRSDVDQNKVNQIVDKIMKDSGSNLSINQIISLREKYDDKIVDEILNRTASRRKKIIKTARKLVSKLRNKYPELPTYKLIKKTQSIKDKLKLTDSEFEEFKRILNNEISYNSNYDIVLDDYLSNRTAVVKALGHQLWYQEEMKIKENEYGVLQDILNIFNSSRTLYHNILLQTIVYQDCAIEAITGQFDRKKNVPHSSIHPLLIALFIPKIKILEIQMLCSNLARIIKLRYDKQQISFLPDHYLYTDILSDPTDLVCDKESALVDLRNRCRVQKALYEVIMHLRSGRYYDVPAANELFQALDSCRCNAMENVDLLYIKDEGELLRKFLSVFSFRPTFIQSTPVYNLSSMYPYGNIYSSFNPMSLTTIPILDVRLPYNTLSNVDTNISLDSAFNQVYWSREGGHLVPKSYDVIYTKDVLFFYVNRKYHPYSTYLTKKLHTNAIFNQIPLLSSTFETVNTTRVDYSEEIKLGNETYYLRSVVTVEESTFKRNLPGEQQTRTFKTGCTALIVRPRDVAAELYENKYLIYDPVGAAMYVKEGDNFYANKPFSSIKLTKETDSDNEVCFSEKASTCGTIFVYAKLPSESTHDPL
jgi:hypothetical protein